MGSFLSRLFGLWSQDAEHKIIIVGLDNAGKTTILYQFNVEEVQFKNMKFLMWDVGGQESLRSSWTTYYTAVEAVLLVIDSTDRERLMTIKEELYSMLAHEDLAKARLLVLANKQDLKGAMTAAELSKQFNLTSIKGHSWHIQACCALTGEGLYEGMEWLTEDISAKR